MKPRRTPPFFFSNRSLYSARNAIAADMSTSLKVVSIAAVFCASFNRWAIVRRSLVMRTRSSRGSSACGARAAGAGAGAGAGRARNSSTSPLVTRPSLPEPLASADGLTPRSSIILAAAGRGACAWGTWGGGVAGRNNGPGGSGGVCTPGSLVVALAGAGASAAADGAGAAGEGEAAACLGAGGAGSAGLTEAATITPGCALAAAAPFASSIWPSRAPTSTSPPSSTSKAPITPAAGALTSTVTLSVSSSTSGSSAATAWPGCFSHRAIVALVTLSPSVGTRISADIAWIPCLCGLGGTGPGPGNLQRVR